MNYKRISYEEFIPTGDSIEEKLKAVRSLRLYHEKKVKTMRQWEYRLMQEAASLDNPIYFEVKDK